MRNIAWVLIMLIALTPRAVLSQTTSSGSLLVPSPFSIVLTVGRWLMERPDQPQIYYIRVRGHGATESDARNEAFKKAVQEAIGSLVLSESRVVNQQLVRREILEYSSGYVDRFKVIDQTYDGRQWIIDIDVWVRHSAIADRVLNQATNTRDFDGARTQAQIESLGHERQQGTRVMAAVLADYPERAYNIRNRTTTTRFNSYRGADLVIDFDIEFSTSYVYALHEALDNTSQLRSIKYCHKQCAYSDYWVFIEANNRWEFSKQWTFFRRDAWGFGFTDHAAGREIYLGLIESSPMIRTTVKDGAGRDINRSCHHFDVYNMVPFRDNYAIIRADRMDKVRIELNNLPNVADIASVEVAIVKSSVCGKFQ